MLRLQKKLTETAFDLCLVDHPIDLFYYTGLQLSTGRLFVQKDKALLLVDGRYIQVATEQEAIPAALDELHTLTAWLGSTSTLRRCAFDSLRTSYATFEHLSLQFEPLLIALTPAPNIYQNVRSIKDTDELQKMRESAQLLHRCFLHVLTLLKAGITEIELARAFEIFALQQGADKLAFDPIIAFGASSAMPHYHPQKIPLQSGDLVLIDIGVSLDRYHSDMTRVVFFEKADPFLLQVYHVVKKSQEAALKTCRPGVCVSMVDEAARAVMRQAQMEDAFLHSLGHGIGLETHEFPRLKSRGDNTHILLETDMVVTVEPGLYYAGKGGVRYEDTIIVTPTGYENLYPEMPEEHLVVFPKSH